MRLSKTAYYADFATYGALVTAAMIVTVWRDTAFEASIWLLTVLSGALLWTMFEYLLHRHVLHRIEVFAGLHDAHHQAPLAFIGTPTWLSLIVICTVIFLPAWVLSSFHTASGLTVGVMGGFWWYSIVHHAIHHRRPRMVARHLLHASRRHSRHHYAALPGNFGVTTSFWDHAFGTTLDLAAHRRQSTKQASQSGAWDL
jgi:sterol desaturase/sphingolipid hydroxylase (fatty acid hydroxylase superfamily)